MWQVCYNIIVTFAVWVANDNLYWLKGAKENLRDIMDDIEAEYNAEMEKNE